ncbi:hypothetical protein Tco_0468691 [Tanacetum coccineum]
MAKHSHNWYDEATTREQINDSPNNVDTKTPKENIHVIQESFKNYKGAHLTMEYPLKKEDKAVEQSKYMRSLEETIIKFCENSISNQSTDNEWIRKFIENTNSNIRALKTTTKNLKEKAYKLTQTILTNTGEKIKERTTMGKEYVKEPVPCNILVQFRGNPYRTHETICAIGIPEEIKEDEGDMNDGCDIMVEDAKVVKKEEQDYDIPLHEHVMQPLTPQTVHITPLDDDYVASATNPILNKHLNEFGEEFADNTRVFEKINSNPVNDLKGLLNTYDFKNFIRKLKHKLSKSSHETGYLYKEMEFEVSLTRVRVVERFCIGITTKVTP